LLLGKLLNLFFALRALRPLREAKAFLSPASLEAAESAEKEKDLFSAWYLKGPKLCVLCGLCGRQAFRFFALVLNVSSVFIRVHPRPIHEIV
jgi:hypothetical protein